MLSLYRTTIEYVQNYLSPNQEKYMLLKMFANAQEQNDDEKVTEISQRIIEENLQQELSNYQKAPKPILPITDGEEYCPRCFGRLTDAAYQKLSRGKLVKCTSSKDAWIYSIHKVPEKLDL
jgi:hypothetical protein